MSENRISCQTCLKSNVCKYIQHIIELSVIGTVDFKCKCYLGEAAPKEPEKDNAETEMYKDMTVDEVSRMLNPRPKKTEYKSFRGKCEVCGKETQVFECEECGRMVCSEHARLADVISIDGEDAKEKLVCPACDED